MNLIKVSLVKLFRKNQAIKCILLLKKNDRYKLFAISILQIFLGFIDLLSVALIGVLGAITVNGISDKSPGNRVSSLLEFFNLETFSLQVQAGILGALSVFLLTVRMIFSVFVYRKILIFLGDRGAKISQDLTFSLLSQPILKVQERSAQETSFAINNGVNKLIFGIIAPITVLVSDISLLIILFLGLLYVNFQIAWIVFFTFLIMGTVINRLLSDRARKLGVHDSNLSIDSSEKLIEALSSYREIIVRGRRDFYALKIGLIRSKLSRNLAETAFLPILIRYIIEGTIVIGSLILSAYQFLTLDAERAISTLTVFLAAGTRIAPAILRIQQGVIQIRGGLGTAAPTLKIIDEIGLKPVLKIDQDYVNFNHASFINKVEIKNLHFNYPGREKPAIDNITLNISSGKIVSIVGRSGAGKTTLVDCILGLLPKTSGDIFISNTTPEVAINKWPGAIGYVPQNITMANCSIEENIGLGFDNLSEASQNISDALEIVGLTEFVNNLTEGLKTQVGERGVKLSGGQRQRLGIARALFTKPKLLILDEATSSLDAESESAISSAIRKISKETTTIIIAHRLNTIRDSDQVVYLDQGKVIYSGTFDEVRKNVPEFDYQAKLMGL